MDKTREYYLLSLVHLESHLEIAYNLQIPSEAL